MEIETIYRVHTPTGYAEFRNEADAQAYLTEAQAIADAEQQPTE